MEPAWFVFQFKVLGVDESHLAQIGGTIEP
jgi:hypothetical protein